METNTLSFADFNLTPDLQRAIDELGYASPTEIQQKAIPILLSGVTDFLGLASTGTGKTAAFAIPLLDKMTSSKQVSALILCPTRELAKQVAEQIKLLGKYKKIKTAAIYGGSDYRDQLRALSEGVDVVIGTPGRIIDHLGRKTLDITALQTVILDEADEMISMGFREEIEKILDAVGENKNHQTWLFSATMSPQVRKIADRFLSSPKQVQINKNTGVSTTVTQFFYQVREEEKPMVVERLIDSVDDFYGLIFCQTKASVIELTESLRSRGYAAECLHGDMDQKARERAMRGFKSRDVKVMVCTDVASRGIDVKDLTHVINYSLPRELDLYVHRIGRTARGGKSGIALNLVNSSHMGLVPRIEKITQTKMTKAQVPSDHDVVKVKMTRALENFLATDAPRKSMMELVHKLLSETSWRTEIDQMSKEDIVGRFLSQMLKVQPITAKFSSEEPQRREGRRDGGRRERFPQRRFERKGGGQRDYKPRESSSEPRERTSFDKPRERSSEGFAGRRDERPSPRFSEKPRERSSEGSSARPARFSRPSGEGFRKDRPTDGPRERSGERFGQRPTTTHRKSAGDVIKKYKRNKPD